MLAALLGLYASTSFTMAAVTPKEPAMNDGYYQIGTYEELVWFREFVNKGNLNVNAKLTEDIYAPNGEVWYPIGVGYEGYKGKFNGCGHKIDGLYAEALGDGAIGFFNYIEETSSQQPFIDSLHITNATFKDPATGKGSLSGGIVATMDGGKILHCSFSGNIKLSNEAVVGGIVGNLQTGTISYCYSEGSLDGNKVVAGIAGESNGLIENCYTTATLSTSLSTEPIAKKTSTKAEINNCFYSKKTKNDVSATSNADFASGRVAYLLNKKADAPFKQNIGTDEFPTFKGGTVYQYENCDKSFKYTNDESMKDKTLEHNWTKYAQKDPTCTTVGNLAYWTCSNEPGVFYKEGGIEKFANEEATLLVQHHEWTEHPAIAPTCTKDGNVHYFSCKYEPGVYYKNNDAKEKLDEVIIPATGHDLEKHVMSASICTKEGESSEFIYYTCKNNKNEFFKEDGLTLIENPEEAIYATTGHDWDVWEYKNTTDNVDTYIRTCKNNADHTETATVPHAWGEAVLVSSTPGKDTYKHTCSSKYGEHSENYDVEFMTEEATYYSQLTGEIDTTLRANTEFKPVDTKNDLLFVGKTSTISGNNVVKGEECENLVIEDKVAFSTPVDFEAKKLSYTRKLTKSDTTLAFTLPYKVNTTDFNGYLYKYFGYIQEKNAIRFTYVENGVAEAGVPYLLYRPTPGKKSVDFHNTLSDVEILSTTVAGSIGNNGFYYFGTFKRTEQTIDSDQKGYLIYPENKIGAVTSKMIINPFRAGLIKSADSNEPARPSLGLIFDEELSGVATIDAEGNLMTGNVDVYDMTGRIVRKNVESTTCLQGLKPGVYVVNGEKFVKTANER